MAEHFRRMTADAIDPIESPHFHIVCGANHHAD
jgi:hypothetical protein